MFLSQRAPEILATKQHSPIQKTIMITTFHTAARLATQLLFLGNICAITNAVNHTRPQGGGPGRGTPAASTKDADAGDASNQSSPGPLANSIQQTRNIGKKINVMMASQVLATRSLVELTSTNKAANPNKIHQHHLTRGGAYDDRKLLSKSFEKIGSGPDGGQLVSFHAAHEINVPDDSNKRESIHSSRKLKKAGSKVSKQTKNSKTPPENTKSKAPKSPKVRNQNLRIQEVICCEFSPTVFLIHGRTLNMISFQLF